MAMVQGIGAAAVAVSCAACSDTTLRPARVFSGVVYGVVKNGSNLPLGGVQVESELYFSACMTSLRTGASSPVLTTTDAAGRFRQQIITADSASGQCVRVIAHPPTGAPVAVEATGLRFRLYGGGSARDDSIRVDVVVP
jgi:hypothetical protein